MMSKAERALLLHIARELLSAQQGGAAAVTRFLIADVNPSGCAGIARCRESKRCMYPGTCSVGNIETESGES